MAYNIQDRVDGKHRRLLFIMCPGLYGRLENSVTSSQILVALFNIIIVKRQSLLACWHVYVFINVCLNSFQNTAIFLSIPILITPISILEYYLFMFYHTLLRRSDEGTQIFFIALPYHIVSLTW